MAEDARRRLAEDAARFSSQFSAWKAGEWRAMPREVMAKPLKKLDRKRFEKSVLKRVEDEAKKEAWKTAEEAAREQEPLKRVLTEEAKPHAEWKDMTTEAADKTAPHALDFIDRVLRLWRGSSDSLGGPPDNRAKDDGRLHDRRLKQWKE